MSSFIARIAAAIRAICNRAFEWVRENGRWIQRLVPGGSAPMPAPIVETAPASSADDDADILAVKRTAAAMAAGIDPTPEHLKGLSDKQLRWLRVLDQRMLCILAVAEPQQIRAHVKGTETIKGMVPCEAGAIADMKAAREAPTPGTRTLRDALLERGIHL